MDMVLNYDDGLITYLLHESIPTKPESIPKRLCWKSLIGKSGFISRFVKHKRHFL